MSAAHSNLQAQVASVLGELVKVATVELTKLFETRYRACVHAERADGRSEEQEQEPEPAAGRGSRRSIGIQVNDSTDRADFAAPQCFWLASGDCLAKEEEEELPTPADSPTVDENEQVNLLWSLLQDVRGGEVNGSHGETGCVKTEAASHDQRPGPSEQSPATCSEQEGGISAGSPVLFVCPLFLKQESPPPEPESSEEPARAEPQHANVSTARGTAYSPSPLDGATAPLQAGAHERARAAKEAESHPQLQLKQTSPDDKLNRPCSVQLVNLLAASKPDAPKDAANCRAGVPTPKDLRCHQGPHTGHRLCCFTPCEDGVWRLHRVVTHTRGGYACDICGKRFKRRKILRRHERFHTGERPYSCSHCSKTFRLRKSARRHERFHTGERPHSCPQCGKCFRLRDNLKAHLRFHTGERPFICSICGKKYRIGKNLEKHNLGQCGFLVPSFRKIAGM